MISKRIQILLLVLAIVGLLYSLSVGVRAQTPEDTTIKLSTFTPPAPSPTPTGTTFVFPTPTTGTGSSSVPTVTPGGSTTVPTGTPLTPAPLPTGGAVPPTAGVYCIDDEDPEGCDDQTAFHVPKGSGGVPGSCGTVIEQAHKLVNSLPQGLKDFRDSLNPAVQNSCHNSGTYSSGYISTFFVIDAYNLAGFKDLSKTNPTHVSGSSLLNWWKSQTASTGYSFIPYSPSVIQQHAAGQKDLTGCVTFLNLNSGVHVGIFNVLQLVNSNGDGVMSILQSGARYYIDRFEVVGWDVKNTPLHQTQLSSIAGFGCHQ